MCGKTERYAKTLCIDIRNKKKFNPNRIRMNQAEGNHVCKSIHAKD